MRVTASLQTLYNQHLLLYVIHEMPPLHDFSPLLSKIKKGDLDLADILSMHVQAVHTLPEGTRPLLPTIFLRKILEPQISVLDAVKQAAKQEREKAQSLVEQLPTLLENLPVAMYLAEVTPTERELLFVSPQIESITGYENHLFLNGDIGLDDGIHPNDRSQVRSTILNSVRDQRAYAIEYRIRTRDNVQVWVHDEGRVNPATSYVQGVLFDITERKHAASQAVEAERIRLARELHDAVKQNLFSANLIAQSLPKIWQKHPQRAEEQLAGLQQLTKGALAEMQTLLFELRPETRVNVPLPELIRPLCDSLTTRAGIPVKFVVDGTFPYPPSVIDHIFRIAQEALNNIGKHAHATQANITLTHQDGCGILVIEDNGIGLQNSESDDRMGIVGMRERVEIIGGELHITSEPKQGTRVEVRIPI